jgi:hypothetical protein
MPMQQTRLVTGALAWGRQNGIHLLLECLANFALPFVVYGLAKTRFGDVGALIAASGPPIVWSMVEFARLRRIDALSLLVLMGIVLSLLGFAGGGGARMLQLREQLVKGVIGLVFLGSAAIGRPLIYQLARARLRRQASGDVASFEQLRDGPIFRRTMLVMTLAWGVGLVADSAIAGILVFALGVREFMVVSAVIGYGALGALTAWTFWYARRGLAAARRPRPATGDRPLEAFG